MKNPKLHHYVPQFYLKLFCDDSKRLWVWDKSSRKVYRTTPRSVASQTYFYRIPEFIGTDVDPLCLEKDLSSLEDDAANLLGQLIPVLCDMQPMDRVEMMDDARKALSTFLSVQFLRTADQREILALFSQKIGSYKEGISDEEKANLHAQMLYSEGIVEEIAERIFQSIWIFARNTTETPFWTSDNPVCWKTHDNRMWLKGPGIFSEGSYVVYPITPSLILYCKEPTHWAELKILDSRLSPVEFTDDMIQHENAGQVFMATRHLIAPINNFTWANEFVETIGTDIYAPKKSDKAV